KRNGLADRRMLVQAKQLLDADCQNGLTVLISDRDAAAGGSGVVAGSEGADLALAVMGKQRDQRLLKRVGSEASRVGLPLQKRQEPFVQPGDQGFVAEIGPRRAFHRMQEGKAGAKIFHRIRPTEDGKPMRAYRFEQRLIRRRSPRRGQWLFGKQDCAES